MNLNVHIFSLLFFVKPYELKDIMKKLKEKAKAYYQVEYGEDSSKHFLGYDITEYPGGNSEYKKIHREKWEKYYNCLKEQDENYGTHGSVTPEAKLGFEGLSIRFECKICISPLEQSQTDFITWYWAPKPTTTLQPMDYTEHIILNPHDKSLTIYNLQIDQSGQYVCFLGQSATAPYFLTIIESSLNLEQVFPLTSDQGPYTKLPEFIEEHNVYLYTEWSSWSPCSKCGKVGKRFKTGYCTIISSIYFENEDNENKINEIDAENTEQVQKYFLLNVTTTNLNNNYNIFEIFKNGIPCQSHILPKEIKELTAVKTRKNELMLGFCKKACENDKVFEVRDKNGNLIETANNSAGVYSMVQELPPAEPEVERKLIYAVKGKKLIIHCPGNRNSDAPIQWQMNNKILIPEIISKETQNRISISILDKIIISNALLKDSNVYSCWQNGELAGTVRLIVEKKIQLEFNHHIMLIGISAICLTFLYIYFKAFLGRKYAQVK